MLTNVEGNREDSPQSTVQPINLHHMEDPLNCRHISKTVDTHLLQKNHCSWSFRQKHNTFDLPSILFPLNKSNF